MSAPTEIPKRALFKQSEVCEIASVQPYVLRSWESEFPDLGVAKTSGGPRIYRRTDVERVLRIKHLVFTDGLTLAGVRRRIEEEAPPILEEADAAPIKELLGRNAKERLAAVKRGLIEILDMLSPRHGDRPAMAGRSLAQSATPARAGKATRTSNSRPASGSRSSKPAARDHRKRSRR